MPKCQCCKRRFFFKKLDNNLCADCSAFYKKIEKQETVADSKELKAEAATKKYRKAVESYKSIQYSLDRFSEWDGLSPFTDNPLADSGEFSPIAPDDLMCLQIKELRTMYRKNEKEVQKLLETYKHRYTTKANATLYQLMVLALEAEFRNILHGIKFGKLDNSIELVRQLTSKYYAIAADANQTIAPTMKKFIGQLEYHYIEAVKIEYNYYVKREQAKEEQRALKEQMRQEAEERRILEQQRKQVEAEAEKYEKEITRIDGLLTSCSEPAEEQKLRDQLEKVRNQLSSLQDKKEEIIRLQNGKAGTVYVISNIGSFGEDVFKVGMTRRLDPMDRIKELSDASVPFPFDVHSFIFSEDAVGLESKLHAILNEQRVNKINLRKEFFRVSLDQLQQLVEECDPSAAFNRTALAEQYRQSLSVGRIVSPEALEDYDEDME